MAPPSRYETKAIDISPLGKPLPFEFSGRKAPNRFLKGAMTERLSSWHPTNFEQRGIPSANLIHLYRRWGEGGIGLILTGNIMIKYDQLEAAGNPIIPSDAPFGGERFEAFRELATQAKAHGSLIVGQVSHPGRQVEDKIQPDPVSASDVQIKGSIWGMTFAKPHAASEKELQDFVQSWTHAAQYLEKAGYDGIELHGAHGYLLSQFLSQHTNHRTDKYGGSLENRARLVIEVVQSIRKHTKPDFILGIKLNSVEFQEQGFGAEEAKELCSLLELNKVDFVELSGGTYEASPFVGQKESTNKREAFFLEFADLIAPALTKTKSYVTGGFKTAPAMVKALEVVDGVGLGRALCAEPHLCNDLLEGKVNSAIEPQLGEARDLSIVAAGAQIRQIGSDLKPLDLSKPEHVQAFLTDVGAFMAERSQDTEIKSGFVEITSIAPIAYGTVSEGVVG